MEPAMANLAAANLLHRKTRSGVAILAVGLEVASVMLLVGLAEGTLSAIAHRLESVGADVLIQPPDASLILGATSAVMPLKLMDAILATPGVRSVAPVLNWHVSWLKGSPERLNLWAVDYPSFARLSGGLDLLQGSPPEKEGDVVVDSVLAQTRGLRLGEVLEMLDRRFQVVGISRAGSGGRIYARLQDIGDAIGTPGKASFFLVKGESSREAGDLEIALEGRLKGYKITPIAQVSKSINDNAVGLSDFKEALTALAVIVSFLVVLLAMYTAIMERTREIGILRAMGATQGYVLRLIVVETAFLCVAGVAFGILLALLGRSVLERVFPSETVLLSLRWAVLSGSLGALGGMLGALYPALKAARLDPVQALNFE
jgi:putative ABC transport system permease protein